MKPHHEKVVSIEEELEWAQEMDAVGPLSVQELLEMAEQFEQYSKSPTPVTLTQLDMFRLARLAWHSDKLLSPQQQLELLRLLEDAHLPVHLESDDLLRP